MSGWWRIIQINFCYLFLLFNATGVSLCGGGEGRKLFFPDVDVPQKEERSGLVASPRVDFPRFSSRMCAGVFHERVKKKGGGRGGAKQKQQKIYI